ncbi:cell-wall agglutinin N-terminal ligand-sugar binding-domain-containing protein [Scheffersomyces coipomensis]|uniref:cell-wall agglutinin N-terminal ligand-sugar binding-domain-containing protein n=1 Tax=Scheffersomyces coipomensis TaxID=1788519 RepID=UPI00315CBBE3
MKLIYLLLTLILHIVIVHSQIGNVIIEQDTVYDSDADLEQLNIDLGYLYCYGITSFIVLIEFTVEYYAGLYIVASSTSTNPADALNVNLNQVNNGGIVSLNSVEATLSPIYNFVGPAYAADSADIGSFVNSGQLIVAYNGQFSHGQCEFGNIANTGLSIFYQSVNNGDALVVLGQISNSGQFCLYNKVFHQTGIFEGNGCITIQESTFYIDNPVAISRDQTIYLSGSNSSIFVNVTVGSNIIPINGFGGGNVLALTTSIQPLILYYGSSLVLCSEDLICQIFDIGLGYDLDLFELSINSTNWENIAPNGIIYTGTIPSQDVPAGCVLCSSIPPPGPPVSSSSSSSLSITHSSASAATISSGEPSTANSSSSTSQSLSTSKSTNSTSGSISSLPSSTESLSWSSSSESSSESPSTTSNSLSGISSQYFTSSSSTSSSSKESTLSSSAISSTIYSASASSSTSLSYSSSGSISSEDYLSSSSLEESSNSSSSTLLTVSFSTPSITFSSEGGSNAPPSSASINSSSSISAVISSTSSSTAFTSQTTTSSISESSEMSNVSPSGVSLSTEAISSNTESTSVLPSNTYSSGFTSSSTSIESATFISTSSLIQSTSSSPILSSFGYSFPVLSVSSSSVSSLEGLAISSAPSTVDSYINSTASSIYFTSSTTSLSFASSLESLSSIGLLTSEASSETYTESSISSVLTAGSVVSPTTSYSTSLIITESTTSSILTSSSKSLSTSFSVQSSLSISSVILSSTSSYASSIASSITTTVGSSSSNNFSPPLESYPFISSKSSVSQSISTSKSTLPFSIISPNSNTSTGSSSTNTGSLLSSGAISISSTHSSSSSTSGMASITTSVPTGTTTLGSGPTTIYGVFDTSMPPLSYVDLDSYYTASIPMAPAFDGIFSFKFSDNAQPGDIAHLGLPNVYDIFQGEGGIAKRADGSLSLTVDDIDYADCIVTMAGSSDNETTVDCTVNDNIFSNPEVSGSITLPLVFNIGGSTSPTDIQAANAFVAGYQPIIFNDGLNDILTSAIFAAGSPSPGDPTVLVYASRPQPWNNIESFYVLGGNCTSSTGSGEISISVTDGSIDCSSWSAGITNSLNAWYFPTTYETLSSITVASCGPSFLVLSYYGVPTGYRLFVSVDAETDGSIQATFNDDHSCAALSTGSSVIVGSTISVGPSFNVSPTISVSPTVIISTYTTSSVFSSTEIITPVINGVSETLTTTVPITSLETITTGFTELVPVTTETTGTEIISITKIYITTETVTVTVTSTEIISITTYYEQQETTTSTTGTTGIISTTFIATAAITTTPATVNAVETQNVEPSIEVVIETKAGGTIVEVTTETGAPNVIIELKVFIVGVPANPENTTPVNNVYTTIWDMTPEVASISSLAVSPLASISSEACTIEGSANRSRYSITLLFALVLMYIV